MSLALAGLTLLLCQDPGQDRPVPTAGSIYAELAERAVGLPNYLSDGHPARRAIAARVDRAVEAHEALFSTGDGMYWRGRMLLLGAQNAQAARAFEAYAADPTADKRLVNEALGRAALALARTDQNKALRLLKRCDHRDLEAPLLTEIMATLKVPEVAALAVPRGPLDGLLLPEIPIEKVVNGPPDLAFDQLKHNVLVIDLFATWCDPCRVTIPRLVALQDRRKHLGVQVIGVTTLYGMGSEFTDKTAVARPVRELDEAAEHELLERYVKTFEINYPVVFTGKNVGTAVLQSREIPVTFVVGRDGKVVGSVPGSNFGQVEVLVEKALAAEPWPAGKK